MSNPAPESPRALPDRPNLRHLKDQAKDLLKSGQASSLADAQFQVARSYGFASWPKLKAHVDLLEEAGQLKDAINHNDLPAIQRMMTRNPALHRAPIGYGNDGPLTWVAECRVPRVPPDETRLAIAQWMIDNGSDVHQGGDGPLMRAALDEERIPMMELLVANGADVNAAWHGNFPILYAACEALNPASLRWLLAHGADPACGTDAHWNSRRTPHPGTALDYLLVAYVRDPERFAQCFDAIAGAGGKSKHHPAVLAAVRGQLRELGAMLNADTDLVQRHFPSLDFGTTAARSLTLQGGTLLHVAAEFQQAEVCELLLSRGADVNARALFDESGLGGQTAVFHAATQNGGEGLPVVRLLVKHGADLSIRAKLPGYYESPGETLECTPFGYARLFPGAGSEESDYLFQCGGRE